jgi:hypothetical protein
MTACAMRDAHSTISVFCLGQEDGVTVRTSLELQKVGRGLWTGVVGLCTVWLSPAKGGSGARGAQSANPDFSRQMTFPFVQRVGAGKGGVWPIPQAAASK